MFGTAVVGAAFLVTASCYTSGGSSGAAVTYYKDVVPILQKNCVTCHVQGGIAPFAFDSYDTAHANSDNMVADTQGHIMPPWGALDTDECHPRLPWKGDMRLSQADLDTIKAWHDQGDVAGNAADAPAPITTTPLTDLPNAQEMVAASYTLKSSSADAFECFVLDPQFTSTSYITGTNIKPGNKTVVHHALVFSVPGDTVLPDPVQYPCFGGPGAPGTVAPQLVAVWAPGAPPYQYPPDVGHPVDPGTKFVMQIHYHPHTLATPEPDVTKFQIQATTTKPSWTVATGLIGNFTDPPGTKAFGLENGPFVIPPDSPNTQFTMEATSPVNASIFVLAVASHMHLVGVDEKITLTRANPTVYNPQSDCLLQTPQWNFNWQRAYEYDAPILSLPTLSKGDKIEMRCTYNNTFSNPLLAQSLTEAGKTQTSQVTLGEQTTDEMCLGAFWYVYPTQN